MARCYTPPPPPVAGTDFFGTRARDATGRKVFCFSREQSWVDSACLEIGEKAVFK